MITHIVTASIRRLATKANVANQANVSIPTMDAIANIDQATGTARPFSGVPVTLHAVCPAKTPVIECGDVVRDVNDGPAMDTTAGVSFNARKASVSYKARHTSVTSGLERELASCDEAKASVPVRSELTTVAVLASVVSPPANVSSLSRNNATGSLMLDLETADAVDAVKSSVTTDSDASVSHDVTTSKPTIYPKEEFANPDVALSYNASVDVANNSEPAGSMVLQANVSPQQAKSNIPRIANVSFSETSTSFDSVTVLTRSEELMLEAAVRAEDSILLREQISGFGECPSILRSIPERNVRTDISPSDVDGRYTERIEISPHGTEDVEQANQSCSNSDVGDFSPTKLRPQTEKGRNYSDPERVCFSLHSLETRPKSFGEGFDCIDEMKLQCLICPLAAQDGIALVTHQLSLADFQQVEDRCTELEVWLGDDQRRETRPLRQIEKAADRLASDLGVCLKWRLASEARKKVYRLKQNGFQDWKPTHGYKESHGETKGGGILGTSQLSNNDMQLLTQFASLTTKQKLMLTKTVSNQEPLSLKLGPWSIAKDGVRKRARSVSNRWKLWGSGRNHGYVSYDIKTKTHKKDAELASLAVCRQEMPPLSMSHGHSADTNDDWTTQRLWYLEFQFINVEPLFLQHSARPCENTNPVSFWHCVC